MKRTLVLFFVVFCAVSAEMQSIKSCSCKGGMTLSQTRNYLKNRRRRTSKGPRLQQRYVGTGRAEGLPDSATGVDELLLVCQSEIYETLKEEVNRYVSDIQRVYGCSITLQTLSGSAPVTELKQMIKAEYESKGIAGAILIGDLPVAFFYHEKYDQTFPSDYYLMELDGQWIAADSDTLEIFTENPDNWGIELFVGRINASNCGLEDETEVLCSYFNKNHRFWSGEMTLPKEQALTCTDRDWISSDYFHHDIQHLYDGSYEDYYFIYNPDDLLNKNNPYNPTDYLEKICSGDYSFVQLACHSDEVRHHFYEYDYNDSEFHLSMEKIREAQPKALGYNLFCCYAGNWTNHREGVEESTPGYLAAAYLFNESPSSLATVTSTKSGGMLAFEKFYRPLGRGDAMGSAFFQWHQRQKEYYDKYSTLKQSGYITWYYGLVLLGDPMISFHFDAKKVQAITSHATNERVHNIMDITGNRLIISAGHSSVNIYNSQGKKLMSKELRKQIQHIELTSFASGIYLVKVRKGGLTHTQNLYVGN